MSSFSGVNISKVKDHEDKRRNTICIMLWMEAPYWPTVSSSLWLYNDTSAIAWIIKYIDVMLPTLHYGIPLHNIMATDRNVAISYK
jgi:hypothetical protein